MLCALALCCAAPAAADAPYPQGLYLYAHGSKSVSLLWDLSHRGRMTVEIDCKGKDWYTQDGPPVNAANHFRMRYSGYIPGAATARKRKDGSTELVPAPPKAKLRLVGHWPTRKRATVFVKHAVCFPKGAHLTLRSQAKG